MFQPLGPTTLETRTGSSNSKTWGDTKAYKVSYTVASWVTQLGSSNVVRMSCLCEDLVVFKLLIMVVLTVSN